MSERTESMVEELRKIYRLKGDTYSSAEVLGAVNRAADEIERLRAVLLEARGWMLCDEDLSDPKDFEATLARVDAALGSQP